MSDFIPKSYKKEDVPLTDVFFFMNMRRVYDYILMDPDGIITGPG